MKNIIGKRVKFNYPKEFTTLPEYSAHRGMVATVTRQLTAIECDDESQPMYELLFDDGWKAQADLWEVEILKGSK